MPASYEAFAIETDAHVATLWLNQPERRNAMGPAFWKELPLVMQELETNPEVRAIVLAAKGAALHRRPRPQGHDGHVRGR